ncbi:MAG: Smr/MutS family protein, partial [Myxococcota bacterium]|nr:Smr/MutS family protein [Myxococcota bacterium]
VAPRPDQLIPGAPVIVPKLGRVEVVEVLADGKVEVRVGSMRATVPLGDVLLDSHRNARRAGLETRAKAEARAESKSAEPNGTTVELVNGVPAGGRSTARTVETTVDVRGQRVDEAVLQLDRFIDESLLAERETVFVIHGHGTGALKTAVRAHLTRHQGVEKFRPGESNEGGDGVTVAFLKG